jgi:hypothetical protein
MISKKIIGTLLLSTINSLVFSQDDMLSLLDSVEGGTKKHEKVLTTFKESRIINLQTTETVKAQTLVFNISHLFGNIGEQSNGGVHTLYGLDNVSDVRFGLDYGITNDLTVGVGRSKQSEMIDGLVKYRIFTQTTDNHFPVSLAVYGDMGINVKTSSTFYAGLSPTSDLKKSSVQRISYVSQLIIARKFNSRLSVEVVPTYQHRNYVLADVNPDNGATETNGLFALATGFRFKITKRVVFVADYFYIFSKYRTNNSVDPFYNPLAVGVEIETGGHVFHLNFTNCSGLIENNFLPKTTDSWLKGGFKFGFNISRVFNVGKRD